MMALGERNKMTFTYTHQAHIGRFDLGPILGGTEFMVEHLEAVEDEGTENLL